MNPDQSILQEMRNQALEIFQVALRAVDPVDATLRHVRREGESLLIGRVGS
jgi:hypothetical protein